MSRSVMHAIHSSIRRERLNGVWYYLRSRGKSFIEGLFDSIKIWKNEFIWWNASCFPYQNYFHLPGTIDDQKSKRTSDLGQDIDKISRLNVMMKKLREVVLRQVDMSLYWLRLGVVPTLIIHGSVHCKRGRDYVALVALVDVLAVGEGSSGRVPERSRSRDPNAFHDFANILSASFPFLCIIELNMNNPPRDASVPHPYGLEVISWIDENDALHLECYGLSDKFKKIIDPVKSFVVLSGGNSHNVEEVVLESKLDGYEDVFEAISTLKATVASLELQKIDMLDKIAMLEHAVRKLKRDLSDSSLRNIDLQKMEEAFSALFYVDYLLEFGFPLIDVGQCVYWWVVLVTVMTLLAIMLVVPVLSCVALFLREMCHEYDGLVVIIFQMPITGLFRSCCNLDIGLSRH
ncbi:unnamed protein product [Lactuca saligna]|uniref:Uncharacterized protein n=1 Tax=Lactuca saligna TaxID=75948 RepID=A0AA35YZ49_LACSI|nr:unnamed protein product [Lactuca saligna]